MDETERQSMGEKGREYVIKNCSWKSISGKVIEICRKEIEEI